MLTALATIVAGTGDGSTRALELRSSTSGALTLTNSREDEAILEIADLAPGGAATGTVTIGNDGSGSGRLSLLAGSPRDEPGIGGGLLSSALELTISDITEAGAERKLYSGALGATPERIELPALQPGEERTYLFSATLPDQGAPLGNLEGDNRYQAAATEVDYEWTLSSERLGDCANEIRGDEDDNQLRGTELGDLIEGLGGDDEIWGLRGDDCLGGGAHADTLHGDLGSDQLEGGRGTDRLLGDGGDDRARGQRGEDHVAGGGGDDELAGGPGRDLLRGGSGEDRLRGGPGRDRLVGGPGADLILAQGGARDVIRCGPGDEVIAGPRDTVEGC